VELLEVVVLPPPHSVPQCCPTQFTKALVVLS
jgi:hypothetical protein